MYKLLILAACVWLAATTPSLAAIQLNSHELSNKLSQVHAEAWLDRRFQAETKAQLRTIAIAFAQPEALVLWRNLQQHASNPIVYADATIYLVAVANIIEQADYRQQLALDFNWHSYTLTRQQYSQLIDAAHNNTLWQYVQQIPPQHHWYKSYRQHIAMQLTPSTDSLFTGQQHQPSTPSEIAQFQLLHGLKVDGIAGKNTQYWLQQSRFQRAHILARNSQRLYALIDHNKEDTIAVNIPSFELNYYLDGELRLNSRIIVGKDDKQTPVLRSTIQKVVHNPHWNVPYRLMRRDLFPKIVNDPDYLSDNEFVVRTSDRSYLAPSEPVENFDWSAHKIQDFPYLLQQKPGPKNVLGQVKFLFPNKHSVYLHDTNSHHLFEQSRRTFSSGCIRVEKAARLSSLLLPNKTLRIEKPRGRVATEVPNDATELADTQQRLLTTDITPQEFIPKRQTAVNIYYLTAWPTPQNEMHYRRDIYHYDAINQADFATLTQHFQPPSDNLLTAEVRGL